MQRNSIIFGTLGMMLLLSVISASSAGLTANTNPINIGSIQILTATILNGTPPYTYNFLVYNSITLVANALYTSNTISTNTFSYIQNSAWGNGQMTANVFITDNESTPVTESNSIKYNVTKMINQNASINNIIQNLSILQGYVYSTLKTNLSNNFFSIYNEINAQRNKTASLNASFGNINFTTINSSISSLNSEYSQQASTISGIQATQSVDYGIIQAIQVNVSTLSNTVSNGFLMQSNFNGNTVIQVNADNTAISNIQGTIGILEIIIAILVVAVLILIFFPRSA